MRTFKLQPLHRSLRFLFPRHLKSQTVLFPPSLLSVRYTHRQEFGSITHFFCFPRTFCQPVLLSRRCFDNRSEHLFPNPQLVSWENKRQNERYQSQWGPVGIRGLSTYVIVLNKTLSLPLWCKYI